MRLKPPRNFNTLLIILIVALVLNSLILNFRLYGLQNIITDISLKNSEYIRSVFQKSLDSLGK